MSRYRKQGRKIVCEQETKVLKVRGKRHTEKEDGEKMKPTPCRGEKRREWGGCCSMGYLK